MGLTGSRPTPIIIDDCAKIDARELRAYLKKKHGEIDVKISCTQLETGMKLQPAPKKKAQWKQEVHSWKGKKS